MTQFKYLLLYTVSICGVTSGCGRLSDADEKALVNEQFSPEAGRAAIVNLLRDDPDVFVNKLSA